MLSSNVAPSPLAISNVSVADGGEIEEAPPDCCDVSPSETMTCDIMPTICEDPGAITGWLELSFPLSSEKQIKDNEAQCNK